MSKKKFNFEHFYKNNYKKFLILPALLFIVSIYFIYVAIVTDGAPIYRDVSLKGGLSTIINVDTTTNAGELQSSLEVEFSDNTFLISELFEEGKKVGFIVDTDLDEEQLVEYLNNRFDTKFEFGENYSSNFISPTLSNAFFKQAITILLISFVLMSIVIFIYFREFVPSAAVVLSAIFDIIVTVGILNMMEFKISIAGIGALLMLLGYSIDTDVLLTNRVFKERGEDNFEKLFFAFKTGTLMSVTTLIAGVCAMLLTNSQVIFEISLILVIGLLVDYISTWLQNSAILLWWLENKDN